jgi:hypothetical protein
METQAWLKLFLRKLASRSRSDSADQTNPYFPTGLGGFSGIQLGMELMTREN